MNNNSEYIDRGELNEFAASDLRQFPDTKPLLLINNDLQIVYGNNAFLGVFGSKLPSRAGDVETEPGIANVINGLKTNNYSSFQFELFFTSTETLVKTSFLADIERLCIDTNEYFLLTLNSLRDKIRIEDKINTLHNALEYGNVPVLITDSSGKVEYATKSIEDILECQIEHFFGKSLDMVFAPFLSEEETSILKNALATAGTFTKVFSGYTDGEVWFKEIKSTPVRRSDDPSVKFIVTANDITNYVQKNRIIKRSEEKQKSIINNISDLLLIIKKQEENLIFENANDNFYEVFSFDRESVGRPIKDILDAQLFTVIQKAIDEDLPKNSTFRLSSRQNGREYLGKLTFIDDLYESTRIFIVSLSDITEQLLYEEKLKRAIERESHISRLKSAFLANMSHEIRTPLNAIVGYSALLNDDVMAGELDSIQEWVSFMQDGVDRLLNVVDNIFEMSLIESDELDLEIKPFSINKGLAEVYGKYLRIAREKNIALNLDADENEISVAMDLEKFIKIIALLVDNAIKYTQKNGIVTIKSEAVFDKMKITITDNGEGIKDDEIKRMFEPFSQEDEGHKRKYEGAGLGLSIAYKLTKLMNGEFFVDSVKNYGTTITIVFPSDH